MSIKSIVLSLIIILVIVLVVWYYFANLSGIPQPSQNVQIDPSDDRISAISSDMNLLPSDSLLESDVNSLEESIANF